MPGQPAARPRFRLTRLGFFYFLFVAALLAIAMIQRLNLMTLFFSVSLTPSLAAFGQGWRNLQRLRVERKGPSEVHAHTPFEVEILVSNPRRWTSSLGLELELVKGDKSRENALIVPLPAAAPGACISQWVRVPGLPRGRHALGDLSLRSRFPIGIFAFARYFRRDDVIVVFPKLGRLNPAGSAHPLPGPDLTTVRGNKFTSVSDQYHHLREYRTGDNPRHIHWPSSARRGEFMVKQFEPEGVRPTLLIIDSSLPDAPSIEQRQGLETLLSYAATVAAEWTRRADSRLTLAILGNPNVVLEGHASPRWLKAVFHALGETIGSADIDARRRIQELLQDRGEGYRVCLASQMLDPATAGRLAREIGPKSAKDWQFLGLGELEKVFSVSDASE